MKILDPVLIGSFDDANVGPIRILRTTVETEGLEDRFLFASQDEKGDGCQIGEHQAYAACDGDEKNQVHVGLQLGAWLEAHPPCTVCSVRGHDLQGCPERSGD